MFSCLDLKIIPPEFLLPNRTGGPTPYTTNTAVESREHVLRSGDLQSASFALLPAAGVPLARVSRGEIAARRRLEQCRAASGPAVLPSSRDRERSHLPKHIFASVGRLALPSSPLLLRKKHSTTTTSWRSVSLSRTPNATADSEQQWPKGEVHSVS